MDAKKCDVCGTFYNEGVLRVGDYEVSVVRENDTSELDICSGCMHRLRVLLQSKKKMKAGKQGGISEGKVRRFDPVKRARQKKRMMRVQETAKAIKRAKGCSHAEALRRAHKEISKNKKAGLCEMCGVKKPEDGEYVCRSCSGTLSV